MFSHLGLGEGDKFGCFFLRMPVFGMFSRWARVTDYSYACVWNVSRLARVMDYYCHHN
jgi:hypothetical protein